ncbi:uncharacterized protein LY79DRAFT_672091 [Colletotrichum navitas]|uniref:Uncharacterized protein n=1 Tax=Colletotrichum navitas TaxID=681940 RepID=A0AAD8PU27_9PEZI|nr:uncharacterized protein LY79DRAFT_672091 [Colletotrichum navitas]KAK1580048.1 hypothetical protein LY79DRAFT_672091 [Colletotrichum navitas]
MSLAQSPSNESCFRPISYNFVILSPLKRGHRRYRPDDELSDDSYYVGIEGELFTPVFIRGRGRRYSPDMSNAYCGVLLGVSSTGQTARLIIPPVDTIEPAFRQVSDGERDKSHTDQQEHFPRGQRCQVLVEDITSEPDYNVFKHMTEDNWELFHLKMPKLVNMKILNGLVDEIKLAIVWSAYHNSPRHQPELAVTKYCKPLQDGEKTAKKDQPVPPVELAVFILYSTHYFRLHEEHGLYAYAHIFRTISCMYKKDKSFDAAFEINIEDIDHKLVSLYAQEHLDANSLEPYHDQEPRELWTAPQTVVRLPWPDINTVNTPPPPHLPREAQSSTAAAIAATVNSSPNGPAARKPNARDSALRAFTYYFSLHVADLRMAKKAGFISKMVTLGPDGHLTWPHQPKRPRETPALPCEIDIKKLVADDATAAKDRIVGRDLVILRMILEEDLASG